VRSSDRSECSEGRDKAAQVVIERQAMDRISAGKQAAMVRLYFNGLSYDEIAARSGVAKGTVANVINDLKAGRVPEARDLAEQVEMLRELAGELRRANLTVGQAATHLALLSHLQELGIEPADIKHWATMCRELAAPGTDAKLFVHATMSLEHLRERDLPPIVVPLVRSLPESK